MEKKADYQVYPKPANFREMVAMMRTAQKEYFKQRTRSAMNKSMHYEKMVDDWLKMHAAESAGLLVQTALNLGGEWVLTTDLEADKRKEADE